MTDWTCEAHPDLHSILQTALDDLTVPNAPPITVTAIPKTPRVISNVYKSNDDRIWKEILGCPIPSIDKDECDFIEHAVQSIKHKTSSFVSVSFFLNKLQNRQFFDMRPYHSKVLIQLVDFKNMTEEEYVHFQTLQSNFGSNTYNFFDMCQYRIPYVLDMKRHSIAIDIQQQLNDCQADLAKCEADLAKGEAKLAEFEAKMIAKFVEFEANVVQKLVEFEANVAKCEAECKANLAKLIEFAQKLVECEANVALLQDFQPPVPPPIPLIEDVKEPSSWIDSCPQLDRPFSTQSISDLESYAQSLGKKIQLNFQQFVVCAQKSECLGIVAWNLLNLSNVLPNELSFWLRTNGSFRPYIRRRCRWTPETMLLWQKPCIQQPIFQLKTLFTLYTWDSLSTDQQVAIIEVATNNTNPISASRFLHKLVQIDESSDRVLYEYNPSEVEGISEQWRVHVLPHLVKWTVDDYRVIEQIGTYCRKRGWTRLMDIIFRILEVRDIFPLDNIDELRTSFIYPRRRSIWEQLLCL